MCEVTWNTWESVSVVLMPIGMKASCIDSPLSLVCFLLLSASLDCFSLFRWCHTAWLKFGSALIPSHAWSSCCCVFLWLPRHLHSLLLPHLVSDHPVLPSVRQLHLPGCGGQIPRALPLWSRAPWPKTFLPLFMSPTTTSSRRLVSNTPRNPPASSGPRMTPTTMTIGKMLTDACRRRADHSQDEGLSSWLRRQSVMIERGDPLFTHLTHKFRVFKKRDTTLKVNKVGFFWTTKRADSRWLSSRDSKTRIPGRLWQKKYSKVEWNDRVAKRNLSCSSRRRTTSTRSSTSSWTVIEAKLGSSWSSCEKASVKWKNWSNFQAQHSTIARKNWSKIEILSLKSLARYRNYKMKSIAWMIREIFKMLNQYAVDIPTLPVNLCLSHLIQFLVEC